MSRRDLRALLDQHRPDEQFQLSIGERRVLGGTVAELLGGINDEVLEAAALLLQAAGGELRVTPFQQVTAMNGRLVQHTEVDGTIVFRFVGGDLPETDGPDR